MSAAARNAHDDGGGGGAEEDGHVARRIPEISSDTQVLENVTGTIRNIQQLRYCQRRAVYVYPSWQFLLLYYVSIGRL